MNKITSSTVTESAPGQPVKPPDAATRWRRLVEDHRVSGMSVSAFCRDRGISQSSLFAWRRKLTGLGVGQETFKAVKVMTEAAPPRPSRRGADDDGAARGAIELWLPGQRRLLVHRGFDRCVLLDLIEALEALA